ncbi:MAG: tRNA threonylcarbamoyladenosine biosynthesis protein RimN [Gallionellales bacterium CG03_land_8_20_14_0_80_55_15]|nr:MAG: tRNA threonylcarbamoyladenosine biosynthesis protein RimN [Gallionellales bacterium CG03_land_8_20_14_0_80_55_15]
MQRIRVSLRRVAAHLKAGGLIGYPTESCYGLGCDPAHRAAVLRLLKLKQRQQRKGLIIIAYSYKQVARYVRPITPAEQVSLRNDAAQAITYLLPAKPSTPRWLRGEHDTLAVRLTAHPFARQLCRGVHGALVSTSANRSGMIPAKTYTECQRMFGKDVWVLPGWVGKRKQPSRIVSWADGKILR